jgi:transcriptional regulator with XRE-family HTH domain
MNTKTRIGLADESLRQLEKITGGKLTLGKALWAIRMCKEMSQTEFAAKLGMSKQQLCDIERGRKNVSPKLAAYYAKQLGESEKQFICLALQDMLDRSGLKITVEVKSSEPTKGKHEDVPLHIWNKLGTKLGHNVGAVGQSS